MRHNPTYHAFHGTRTPVTAFTTPKFANPQGATKYGPGSYFASTADDAAAYSIKKGVPDDTGHVYEVELRLERPLRFTGKLYTRSHYGHEAWNEAKGRWEPLPPEEDLKVAALLSQYTEPGNWDTHPSSFLGPEGSVLKPLEQREKDRLELLAMGYDGYIDAVDEDGVQSATYAVFDPEKAVRVLRKFRAKEGGRQRMSSEDWDEDSANYWKEKSQWVPFPTYGSQRALWTVDNKIHKAARAPRLDMYDYVDEDTGEKVRLNPGKPSARGKTSARSEWLARVFRREQRTFGLPQAGLGISASKVERRKPRDYACAVSSSQTIWFHPAALTDLSDENLVGLVRHELAHLLDPNLSESDTDLLAERVTGAPLYYDKRLVQTTRKGRRPRPSNLPEW